MKIITRKQAKSEGKITYYNGKPCKHGHIGVRRVVTACCVECARERATNSYKNNKHKPEQIIRRLWSSAKNRARLQKAEFTITQDDVVLPTHCPVFGMELKSGEAKGKATECSPSLDRIDPSKGYVPGNVEVVSIKANVIKNDGTPEEHLKIYEYYSNL